jgi:hypothetical protein
MNYGVETWVENTRLRFGSDAVWDSGRGPFSTFLINLRTVKCHVFSYFLEIN